MSCQIYGSKVMRLCYMIRHFNQWASPNQLVRNLTIVWEKRSQNCGRIHKLWQSYQPRLYSLYLKIQNLVFSPLEEENRSITYGTDHGLGL